MTYPWDDALERIKVVPRLGDDDAVKRWVLAFVSLRWWERFLALYLDLRRDDRVEFDAETALARVIRYNVPDDLRHAVAEGDTEQFKAVVVQLAGPDAARYVSPPKQPRGVRPYPRTKTDRLMNYAVEDFYAVRDLLHRHYAPTGERMWGFRDNLINLIANYHHVNASSLVNRINRPKSNPTGTKHLRATS